MSIVTKSISANGCVALWELSGTFDLAQVRAAFSSVGLSDVAPYARTPLACLEASLRSLYGKRGVLIRPLGSDGYAVVEDVPHEAEMRMDHRDVQAARVNADGTLTIREDDVVGRYEIEQRYNAARGQIDHEGLSAALTQAIVALSGTPVRARGGVYWLPGPSAAKWSELGKVLGTITIGQGRAALYSVTTVGDADTVRAISAAFTRQADAAVAAVSEALPTTGKRAAANRAAELQELSALADYYATVLGTSLAEVRARIDIVAAQAGAAAVDAL